MNDKLYVLRVVKPDMTSRGPSGYSPKQRFKYPESGLVECPDWQDDDNCGHGLHGWLWGAGELRSCDYWNDEGAKWLVVEVATADLRHGSGDLVGKCKFRRGNVVFCGARDEAVKLITERAPAGTPILFGTATAGDRGTATAGDRGTATAGDRGTATAGYAGTATAGDRGTATAGDRGTATAGYAGTATAGYAGTATAGDRGTATAGDRGVITLLHWTSGRYKRVIGEIGENGLKPNTPYILDAAGKIVEKKS
jgi:hypothetical protein